MNGITRNLLVILSTALLSIGTVSVLLFFEARAGHPLFSYMLANYVPAGALAAGLVAAAGLLSCSLLLRARPAPIVVIALVAISAGIVFLAQSTELMLASAGRAPASDPATFAQFLANSVLHSPVEFQGAGAGGSSSPSSPSTMGVARAIPQSGPDNNAQVDSISSGVQGVVASQDVGANVSAGGVQRISQIGDGIQSINSAVQNHGSQWLLMALQFVGFSLGSVVVFSFLRSRPHCDDCSVLLSGKGTQKRYFDRQEEINGSVEDVLAKAKNRRLQLSIQAHGSRGSVRKGKLSEFASIVNVSLCKRCQTHRVDFRALRKSGLTWKEIAVLAYSASSFDPIEIGG
jgi:hypothetical protein